MRILVFGGRTYGTIPRLTPLELWEQAKALADAQRGVFWDKMDPYHNHANLEIIQGGADGADECARDWAKGFMHRCRTFRADWKAHGRSAGPKRNQQMIDEGMPDRGMAFPGGAGTADMVRRLRKAGIRVDIVE